jgi:hypothetical protein
MARPLLLIAALLCTTVPAVVRAQGIVVDQGQFTVRVAGATVGTESFVIRRAGLGRDDAIFANAVASLRLDGDLREIRPLLRALPPDGVTESYQVQVTGTDALEARLARSGRRYVATIRSAVGDEDREFQARADTRVIELGLAHHYYFLRDVREGRQVHVIEPRTRRQVTLTVASRADAEITLGPNTVPARRVELTSDDDDHRTIWYDRQGRVLRVEIPSLEYVAERTDLVG